VRRKKTLGAEEARATLPELLEQAHRGRVTVITKRGQPYAALVPVESVRPTGRRLPLLSLRGTGAGLWGSDPREHIRRMRDEW
jgi:prevent-host-death family protein